MASPRSPWCQSLKAGYRYGFQLSRVFRCTFCPRPLEAAGDKGIDASFSSRPFSTGQNGSRPPAEPAWDGDCRTVHARSRKRGSQPDVGNEPMVRSYRQFGAGSMIHRFEIRDRALYDFGSVAMDHLRFLVDHETTAGRCRGDGPEIYAIDASGPHQKSLNAPRGARPARTPDRPPL